MDRLFVLSDGSGRIRLDGQTRLQPRLNTAVDVVTFLIALLDQNLGGGAAAIAAVADHVNRFVFGQFGGARCSNSGSEISAAPTGMPVAVHSSGLRTSTISALCCC